jgi:hypothetical protein
MCQHQSWIGAEFAVGHEDNLPQVIQHAGQFFQVEPELGDITDVPVSYSAVDRTTFVRDGKAEQKLLEIGPMVLAFTKRRFGGGREMGCLDLVGEVVGAKQFESSRVGVKTADDKIERVDAANDNIGIEALGLSVEGIQCLSQPCVVELFTGQPRVLEQMGKVKLGERFRDVRTECVNLFETVFERNLLLTSLS